MKRLVLLALCLLALARIARADDAPSAAPGEPGAHVGDAAPAIGAGATDQQKPSTRDIIIFWSIGGMVILGALATITRKNPIVAVMCLVGTFFGLAVVYVMLLAHFLAIIQVLVYAGAIMVLFVFVVMIINRDETDTGNPVGWIVFAALTAGAMLGRDALHIHALWVDILALVVLLGIAGGFGRSLSKGIGMIGAVLVTYTFIHVLTASSRAIGLSDAGWSPEEMHAFGTTRGVGQVLFSQYLFPFEAVSLLLLIAVIGATVLARPHAAPEDDADREKRRQAVDARPPIETLRDVDTPRPLDPMVPPAPLQGTGTGGSHS